MDPRLTALVSVTVPILKSKHLRIGRRLEKSVSLDVVFQTVEVLFNLSKGTFDLHIRYPKKIFESGDLLTLKDAGVDFSCVVDVVSKDSSDPAALLFNDT